MNIIQFKCANWFFICASIILIGLLTNSCSKKSKSDEPNLSEKLVISVIGINEDDNYRENKASLSSNKQNSHDQIENRVYTYDDVDMVVSIDNKLPVKGPLIKTIDASAGLIAATPLGDNIKYVVYIYDEGVFVKSVLLAAGTAGTIEELEYNGTYQWVALSYHSETESPSLTPVAGSIALPQNTDVLYATGIVDLSENTTINILFNHAFARVGIELNTIGIFGEISDTPLVNVSGINLASGSIDLVSGVVTAGSGPTPTLTYADFINVDPACRTSVLRRL